MHDNSRVSFFMIAVWHTTSGRAVTRTLAGGGGGGGRGGEGRVNFST